MARNLPAASHPYARQSALFGIIVGVVLVLIWIYRIATGGCPTSTTRCSRPSCTSPSSS